ncbi:MAG: hypothetical protein ACUVWN_08540 [bacterium]
MFDVIHKNKGGYVYFATLQPKDGESHLIYISGYGQIVSDLVEKYISKQRVDHEELFSKWDELIEEAKNTVGYSSSQEIEDGYFYVTTFQNGIGVSAEDEAGVKRYTAKGRRRRAKISIISPDLTDSMDMDEEHEEDFDLDDEIVDDGLMDEDQ